MLCSCGPSINMGSMHSLAVGNDAVQMLLDLFYLL